MSKYAMSHVGHTHCFVYFFHKIVENRKPEIYHLQKFLFSSMILIEQFTNSFLFPAGLHYTDINVLLQFSNKLQKTGVLV